MSDEPSADNKTIARTAVAAFGGEWSVHAYGDEGDRSTLDILSADDTPEEGLISFCTIGLSDRSIPGEVRPPLGVELVGTHNRAEFANVLATAGFHVLHDGWIPEPGNVFADIVSDHFDDVRTPHLYLATPYLWDGLDPQELTAKTVAFLQVVPITEAERAYRAEHGSDVFESRLEEGAPDIVDLWRDSTVVSTP